MRPFPACQRTGMRCDRIEEVSDLLSHALAREWGEFAWHDGTILRREEELTAWRAPPIARYHMNFNILKKFQDVV